MKQIFKKGDKVFCHYFGGWGKVEDIYLKNIVFPIRCSFPLGDGSFTEDGRFWVDGSPMLSFTEYTLEGFSQQRPEPLPKRGDVVWVRDFEDDNWEIMHFLKYDVNVSLPYIVSEDMTIQNSDNYKFLTTKNPYANEQ